MNTLEKKMVELLKDLRDNYGAAAVKAEFETEGTRLNELIRLKDVVAQCQLGIILKIGGAEAVRDIFDALVVGVAGIVAPMIESEYALQKFMLAVEKFVPADILADLVVAINVETKQAADNLAAMLKKPKIERLNFVTVGRVDLSGSMGLSRAEINSEAVLGLTKKVFSLAKNAGLKTTIGGGISAPAIPFLEGLIAENLLDRYETRKIIFSAPTAIATARIGLVKANQFELLWLQNKANYYAAIAREDQERINMLEARSSL